MKATYIPSGDELAKALSFLRQDCTKDEAWRSLVLKAIDHGVTIESKPAIKDEEQPKFDPKRIEETKKFLLTALHKLNAKKRDKDDDDDEEMHDDNEGTHHEKARDIAEDIIVDALWLTGTMLQDSVKEMSSEEGVDITAARIIAPDDSSDDEVNGVREPHVQQQTNVFKKSYTALCKLTSELVLTAQGDTLPPLSFQKLLASLEPQHLKDSNIFTQQVFDLFIKKIRKLNTDMYYRQKKVNLMQEESEGYAKYMRMLIDIPMYVSQFQNETGQVQSAIVQDFDNIVETAKLNVVELIGTFDLDPNRCLDLTLDAMENTIRQIIQNLKTKKTGAASTASTVSIREVVSNAQDFALNMKSLMQILHLFPFHNISHLIGFKFASYSNGGCNQHNSIPETLYYLTAILAANGILSLSSLPPHLPPLTDITKAHDAWKKMYQKKIRKMGVVSLNSAKKKEEEVDPDLQMVESMKHNPSIQIFETMLDLGTDFNSACEIFSSKPIDKDMSPSKDDMKKIYEMLVKCCCVNPSLGTNLCKILNDALKPLMKAKLSNIGSALMKSDGDEDGEVSSAPIVSFLLPTNWRSIVLEIDSEISLLELCQTIEHIMEPIISSGSMASDPKLYCNLCRLYRAMLLEAVPNTSTSDGEVQLSDNEVDEEVFKFIERCLVGTLSLFPLNPAIASDLWSILSLFPCHLRYALYFSWRKHGLEKAALRSTIEPSKPLAHVESEVSTGISTKYLLKRMSKDNIKDMGRQVSKVAHNNPLVVFTLMLNQIESYDNLILMMVETFKFMSVLSLDVVGYCLLVSIGGEGEARNKLQDDGVNAAQWLSSLETFTGAFYRRFASVELGGLLSYFTRRLHQGHTLELGVLQSLLKMTGGYGFVDSESTAILSEVQLEGRCGSLALRRETSDFGIVEKVNISSSRKLRASLQSNSSGIIFVILIAQLRSKVLYSSGKGSPNQIKLVGNLYDKCHRTLNILLSFLTDGSQDDPAKPTDDGTIATFAKQMPHLDLLCTKFAVPYPDAWTICRPLIRASLFAEEDQNLYDASMPEYLEKFHPKSKEMEKSLSNMVTKGDWNHMSKQLFSCFYTYSIYDIGCPVDTYKNEIARVKREIDRLEIFQKGGKDALGIQASMISAAAAAGGTSREIRDATTFTKEHARELDRCKNTEKMLERDMDRQEKHSKHVLKILESGRDTFFKDLPSGLDRSSRVFFTTCIYPRCLISPEDALYCARFIMLLHGLNTPGFSTMEIIDVIVNSVVGALYSITEDEAGCFGIFLNEMWKYVSQWRYDEEFFKNHVDGKVSHCISDFNLYLKM